MQKIFKLGWILVATGIISRQQLEKALVTQKKHPTRSIGEIINKLYDIPEGKIEAIFISGVLIPTLSNYLYSELEKKITITDVSIKDMLPEIVIRISAFQRRTISSLVFNLKDTNDFEPSEEKKFLSTIDCTIDQIILRTSYHEDIVFDEVTINYDIQQQEIRWDNPAIIMEAKIKLNQIFKKNLAQNKIVTLYHVQ